MFSLFFGRWSLNEFHLASFVGIANSCLQPKAQDTRRHSQSCLVESIESVVASQAVTFRIKNQRFDAKVLIYFWPFETKGSASLATVICTLEMLERIVTLSNYEPPLKVLVPTETSQEREASSSNSFSTLGLGPWNVDVWFSSLAIILTQQLQNSLAIIKVSDQSLAATGQRGKPSGPGMVLKHFHKDQSRLKSRARKWTC